MSKSYRNNDQNNNSSSSAKNNRGKTTKFSGKNVRQGRESLLDLEDDSLQEMFASRFDCND